MSSKPAIVFVTGSFCPPSFYDNISTILRSRGYELSIPPLRTVGKKPGPAPTMYDDAAGVAAEVTKFADQGKDVVLIAHSYGGVVASQAVQGLSKKEREQQGKTGGVVRVAYMTALVPDLGAPGPSALSQESTGSEYITVDEVYCFSSILCLFIGFSSQTLCKMLTQVGWLDGPS
jgi:pimeloyl-ACP methyl ester carboxylesterase